MDAQENPAQTLRNLSFKVHTIIHVCIMFSLSKNYLVSRRHLYLRRNAHTHFSMSLSPRVRAVASALFF